MKRFRGFSAGALTAMVIAVVVAMNGHHSHPRPSSVPPVTSSAAPVPLGAARAGSAITSPAPVHPEIGFASRERLDEHFAKHGREFGNIDEAAYLRMAQTLRDRPAGGEVEELVRADGTVSRFDRGSGAFIAFDSDLVIRTCFKPNDGEAYFRRQAGRTHG
jgi:hypothetical protein